ncbi:MAG: serine/threonine protein kinase [Pirellulales bacterium]|nr:serine/threonine protein kinase [Pirellulales bacterium]
MSDGANPPISDALADLAGRQLGDYRLLRRLGRGAMADVYLAEQCSLHRQVAFKVLKPELTGDPKYIERFQREARSAAALVHGNIVQVHEVGRLDGVHYMVQEYVPGQNLRQLIARQGPLDVATAANILWQVAAALVKAAEGGIIHRDIKPENILLTRSGEVKVADFGLARLADAGPGPNLTQVGVTMGTPLYMSPEQVQGQALDARSDLYSLGVTTYHMLAGKPPFEGESALAVAVQHLRNEPVPLETLRGDLPISLCRLVHRLLAKAPEERIAGPRELLAELRRLALPGIEVGWSEEFMPAALAGPPASDPSLASATQQLATVLQEQQLIERARPRRDRRPLALAAALVLALAAGAGLAWRLQPPGVLASADPNRTEVPRQQTAIEQLFYAAALNTEDAWLAVRQYHGDDLYYVRLADEQLGRLYLHAQDYTRALEVFTSLADLNNAEEEFRAFGLAGQCVVYSMRNEHAQSAQKLAELWPLRQHLDPAMGTLISEVVERNQAALSPRSASQWREWSASMPLDTAE